MNKDHREIQRKLRILLHAEETGHVAKMDLSRFSAAPGSHLSCHSFESQGAFPS